MSEAVAAIPILHDCAAGIADVQVRNHGTIGGSLAEADRAGTGRYAAYAGGLRLRARVRKGKRTIKLEDFIKDAFTTVLGHEELGARSCCEESRREIVVERTWRLNAARRCMRPRVRRWQLTVDGKDICKDIRVVLGCVGLMAIRAKRAEDELRWEEDRWEGDQRVAEAARGSGPNRRAICVAPRLQAHAGGGHW